jgi:hypothetical protein
MRILLLGIFITASSWLCAWSNWGLFSEYSFFPLWLGYILVFNGLSEALFGTSLLQRMRLSFIWLFILSIPMWWFFERINRVVQNWHYEMNPISNLHYFVQASIDFSTVIPAVLSTSFLFHQVLSSRQDAHFPTIVLRSSWLWLCLAVGALSFYLINEFPREAFPLVWIAPILVIEPIAYATNKPCILRLLEKRD